MVKKLEFSSEKNNQMDCLADKINNTIFMSTQCLPDQHDSLEYRRQD